MLGGTFDPIHLGHLAAARAAMDCATLDRLLFIPSGRYRISFEPVTVQDTGNRERDVDAVVAEYTKTLERWVRKAPEQYFWHHRRWKRQPDDTPDDLRDPAR